MSKKLVKIKPGVFIIESCKLKDEVYNRQEGKILAEIFNILEFPEVKGKPNVPTKVPYIYKYIRTLRELDEMMEQYNKSGYRYLHLSCHGDKNSFGFTLDMHNGISFDEFATKYSAFLDRKRLFLSSCLVGNKRLADNIFSKTDCRSVIGPSEEICFDDAAILWASFYHLIFNKVIYEEEKSTMSHDDIQEVIGKLCPIYKVKLNCYFRDSNSPLGYSTYKCR